MRVPLVLCATALLVCACGLGQGSSHLAQRPMAGAGDYQTCSDVSSDIVMMGTYGMLFGPESRQMSTDAMGSSSAVLRKQAESVYSAADAGTGAIQDSPVVSSALGTMAGICRGFGLYKPVPVASPTTTTPYVMPVGPGAGP